MSDRKKRPQLPAEAQERPAKPTECADGCPDQQVCDHCQWPPGPDAEAQAVAVCGERPSESFGPRFTPEEWDRLSKLPPGTKLYTAPPSAPVGVEAPPENRTATEWLDFCNGHSIETVVAALTQQPAAPHLHSGEWPEGSPRSVEAAKAYIRDWCPDYVKDYIDAIAQQPAAEYADANALIAHLDSLCDESDEKWDVAQAAIAGIRAAQQPAAVDGVMVERINQRFTSGNSVQVERAHITAEEWQALSVALAAQQGGRIDD